MREKSTSNDPVFELRVTTAEVRQAYKRLLCKCHPDKNPTATEMANYFSQKAQDAIEILTNEEIRKQYDDWLKAHGRYDGGRGGMRVDNYPFSSKA